MSEEAKNKKSSGTTPGEDPEEALDILLGFLEYSWYPSIHDKNDLREQLEYHGCTKMIKNLEERDLL
tara:strand:+ start:9297 stop:9497 length:201 start_codon:yes stop_codon:yes gene_type:complete